jgi:hypothetical protein
MAQTFHNTLFPDRVRTVVTSALAPLRPSIDNVPDNDECISELVITLCFRFGSEGNPITYRTLVVFGCQA